MRTLNYKTPTPEQLSILSKNTLGVEVIRGAAGSGKTTTALLRLQSLVGTFVARRNRMGSSDPVRILVLTYNKTLRGYISELTRAQVETDGIEIEISTFGKWAFRNYPVEIIEGDKRKERITTLGAALPLGSDFLLDEVEYVMGRFLTDELGDYLTARRDGRGTTPRVDRALRKKILDEVIFPYQKSIEDDKLWDWNDLAVYFANNQACKQYDVIVVDEAQDFSANQLRAIINQKKAASSITFVLDSAQRIYARGYNWQEVGVVIQASNSHRLKTNYRNTKEVAALARSILDGLPADDDATMPDFSASTRNGEKPTLLKGYYSDQITYVLDFIRDKVDLEKQSVVFLKPLGGGWFDELRKRLAAAGLDFVDLTKRNDWPTCNTNIGISTLHSAKGLEFDFVVMIGLNAQVTPHGIDPDDDKLQTLRRLLAMGVGRARDNVIIGCKPDEASSLIDYIDPSTYEEVLV